MMRLRLLSSLFTAAIVLQAAVPALAVELSVSLASPVSPNAVLGPDGAVDPLDIATHGDQFGVLFTTEKDFWFSIVDGDHELVSTHLMTAAGYHKFSLPRSGAAFWTGNHYLAFWTLENAIHVAQIDPDGEIVSSRTIIETSDEFGIPFSAAWNPLIDRGLIMWNESGALFGPDGDLVDTFAMETVDQFVLSLPRLIPFGTQFAGVTDLRTPEITRQSIVELFDTSGGRRELRRFDAHIDVEAAPCGDQLLVMERGTVQGHSAHNLFRIDAAGNLISFMTLRETPEPVPFPLGILACDPEGFEQVVSSEAGTAIERVIGGEVVSQEQWETSRISAAARAAQFVLLAGPRSYIRDDARPSELIEIPLLLSATDQIPIDGASAGDTDIFIMSGAYILILDRGRQIVRALPEGRDYALAVSRERPEALIVWNARTTGTESGIRALKVDLGNLDVGQPFAVSSGDDRAPSVAPHGEDFFVVWERAQPRDLSTVRAEIIGRIVPRAGPFPGEEQTILDASETGHYSPLLRSWGDGYLLLSSVGTVCWRLGCMMATPLDLEATRLDHDLQALWNIRVDQSGETDERPSDVSCSGDRCFAVWSRVQPVGDPCIVLTRINTVGTALIHDQGFVSAPRILDEPGLDDSSPTVGRIGNEWFVTWVTDGRPGCEAGEDADLRGALFSRQGSPLLIDGKQSIRITDRSQDEHSPLLIEGADSARLFYATITPEERTGAGERLQERRIVVEPERRRSTRR